ncbi:iron ABC transporter permease [Roseomonas sp. OT10]|uniref:ABC transporter permease n=1 Tax=Roseomonas cutis TaxID=2897332 RepID=UPI001E4E90EA|nr:iron ABC transporter permease [Roseomonas sp. OT10]UFN48273.1 iron ABC transporter permease [Roseomonas sp. OT10]
MSATALPHPPPRRSRLVLPPPYLLFSWLAIAGLAFLIVYPLGRMLLRTFLAEGALTAALGLFAEPWLPGVLANTAIVVLASTVLAVLAGGVLAWINERTDANLGGLGFILPVIPLLIPNVALAIGWVFVAAPQVGFLNGLLAALPAPFDSLQTDIYGWTGLIFVYSLNGIPFVYLMLSAAFQNLDPALEEASRVSGAGLARTLWRVSLPAIAPSILASAILVVINGMGVYSIPAIIATHARIDLLTTRIVAMLTKDYPPNLVEAQMLGFLMLALVGLLWWVQVRASRAGQFVTLGGKASGSSRVPLGPWRWPARSLLLAFIAASCFIPAAALLLVSLQPFWTPSLSLSELTLYNFNEVLFVNRMTGNAFRNSLMLSAIGAAVGMLVAVLAAVQVTFRPGRASRVVDFLTRAPAAFPNLVIAIGILVSFSGAPFYLSGTALILLFAFVVMYLPPGSIAANAAVAQIGRDLREASAISGAGEGRTLARIVLPLALPGIVAGWTIVFVHMMGDLSAAALLAGLRNPVIGFAILEIWETGSFGLLAAFSLIMCLVNLVVVGSMMLLVRRSRRR